MSIVGQLITQVENKSNFCDEALERNSTENHQIMKDNEKIIDVFLCLVNFIFNPMRL